MVKMTFLKTHNNEFILENDDTFLKRSTILAFSILCWWASEYLLRPMLGSFILNAQSIWGKDYSMLGSHIFSQGLSVLAVSLILLVFFIKIKKIPRPQFYMDLKLITKEGFLWGVISCLPVIPLALGMGFRIGFLLDSQKIIGNIFSNSYEEIIYRAFLFLIVTYTFKRVSIGILFSAILFGIVHNQYPISLQITVGFAGICFSLAYIRSNSILAALLAHQLADMILDSILIQ